MHSRIYNYRRDAFRRGIAWQLDSVEAMRMFRGVCHYCGKQPSHLYSGETELFNGIDRVDSKGDYETTNVVTCCKACNRLKGSLGYTEFKEYMKSVAIGFIRKWDVE